MAQKCNPSKNRERDGVLALGGRRSVKLHNNQPKVSVGSEEGIQEEMQPGQNMWEATFARHLGCWSEEQKIIQIKYVVAIGGRKTTNLHNNQPKTGGCNQGGIWEEVQPGGSAGEAWFHCFGGDWVGSSYKLKQNQLVYLLFFLWQFK